MGARIDRENIEAELIEFFNEPRHVLRLARVSVADERVVRAGIFESLAVQAQRVGNYIDILALVGVPLFHFGCPGHAAVFCARLFFIGARVCRLLNEVVELAHMYGRFRVYREVIEYLRRSRSQSGQPAERSEDGARCFSAVHKLPPAFFKIIA